MNRFTWTDHAQAELRQIEQQQALEILHAPRSLPLTHGLLCQF